MSRSYFPFHISGKNVTTANSSRSVGSSPSLEVDLKPQTTRGSVTSFPAAYIVSSISPLKALNAG